MKAELLRAPIADVRVSHLGDSVSFDLKYWEKQSGNMFGKDGDENILEPFNEINQYWASLPEETQLQIFLMYKKIRELLDTEYEIEPLQEKLTNIFSVMMDYHRFEDIKHFIDVNIYIYIPNDIDSVFDPKSTNIIGTRERTYIKEDYKSLVILSIALRPLGIVWGEYIMKAEKAVSNIWKELNAFYLLLDTWVLESEPMKRLEVYVEANVSAKADESDNGLAAAIIAGIGTEDYPRWLLALTIMRKVVFADLTANSDKGNIIQSIYGYIQSKLNNSSTSFKLTINNKNLQVDVDGEKDKLSFLESYKSKEDISGGDICLVEHALVHPYELARELEPGIDPVLVREAVESSHDLLQRNITEGQIILAQWVMAPVIPARIMKHLDKSYVILALAITEAVLWSRGFRSLAAIVGSYPLARDNTIMEIQQDPIQVPKDLTDRMDNYYPYARRASNKATKKKARPASIAVSNICKRLSLNDWYLTIPNHWMSELSGVMGTRRYSVQPDLKLRLTELIIDLNERIENELPATARWVPNGLS